MGKVTDITGAVTGTTVYVNGQLKARNTTITLPEVTHVIATVQTSLGEHEVPLYGLIESMETTIQKIGVDYGLVDMIAMSQMTYEFRWKHQVTKADGSNTVEGCKAFIRGVPKIAVPQIELSVGENVELDIPLATSRYQLFANGQEICLIDKLAGICKIGGIDYASYGGEDLL